MKCVDWKRLVFGPFEYFLKLVYEDPIAGALQTFLSVLQKLLLTTCNTDDDSSSVDRANRRNTSNLQTEVAMALAVVEQQLPISLLVYIVHSLVHIPQHIYRWNNVRNYWAFFSER